MENVCLERLTTNIIITIMAKTFHLALLLQVCVLGGTIEMPPYQVLNTAETYEERIYPAQKWVTSTVLSISHNEASNAIFDILFTYIDGNNENGVKVDMTSPVTILVQPGEGPNCENTFTGSFYIPSALQDNPPHPSDPNVYIEERPELHLFSKRFHGFTNDQDWITNAAQLADDLMAAGEDGINFQTYYTAGYDSPFVIVNRTNEVWLMTAWGPGGEQQVLDSNSYPYILSYSSRWGFYSIIGDM